MQLPVLLFQFVELDILKGNPQGCFQHRPIDVQIQHPRIGAAEYPQPRSTQLPHDVDSCDTVPDLIVKTGVLVSSCDHVDPSARSLDHAAYFGHGTDRACILDHDPDPVEIWGLVDRVAIDSIVLLCIEDKNRYIGPSDDGYDHRTGDIDARDDKQQVDVCLSQFVRGLDGLGLIVDDAEVHSQRNVTQRVGDAIDECGCFFLPGAWTTSPDVIAFGRKASHATFAEPVNEVIVAYGSSCVHHNLSPPRR